MSDYYPPGAFGDPRAPYNADGDVCIECGAYPVDVDREGVCSDCGGDVAPDDDTRLADLADRERKVRLEHGD